MERRGIIRHNVQWSAGYRLGSSAEWRASRVVNMAKSGIAIEPFGLHEDDRLSGEVEVKFELPDYIAENFHLLGDIRHVTRTSEERVLLGIQFKGVTRFEETTLDELRRGLDIARLTSATHHSSSP
jgi:hypothetical protein